MFAVRPRRNSAFTTPLQPVNALLGGRWGTDGGKQKRPLPNRVTAVCLQEQPT
ncbi:MAG: hypothetical protein IPM39_25915 [Chloroflexi bacterium]|nr:hypothetical protein [Chloroflexota bacterium]